MFGVLQGVGSEVEEMVKDGGLTGGLILKRGGFGLDFGPGCWWATGIGWLGLCLDWVGFGFLG